MCGINGILNFDVQKKIDQNNLLKMRDSISHRGPDDAGFFINGNLGLGHRRLSILDTSVHGRQPMSTLDGRFWIVFNGEIYNFHELRKELETKGYSFHSNSDTEVLLYMYQQYGGEMLFKLNGMFAFAIWDKREKSLFIARDRMGIKPLYYTIQNNSFYFASEQKAIFAAGINPEFDESKWHELLYFKYIAGEDTPFKNIKRLLPGHYMLIKNRNIELKRWWNLAEIAIAKKDQNPKDTVEWFKDTFDSAVNLHSISDVPVGILLSGGLDSSSVATSLALQTKQNISTFTVRFEDQNYDEGPVAEELAKKYGLDYNEMVIDSKDHFDLLHQSAWLNDEPLIHQNDLFIYAISKFAKSKVSVLLSGEGGDELLGGYVRHRPLRYPNLLNFASSTIPAISNVIPLGKRWIKLANFLRMPSLDHFILFNSCSLLPHNLKEMGVDPNYHFDYRRKVIEEAKTVYPNDRLRQLMYYDQHVFLCSILDRNDRMTMGASIECRVPFLDYRIVENLAALPTKEIFRTSESKSLLREAVGNRLTPKIQKHRKMGLPVPWAKYINDNSDLKLYVKNLSNMEIFKNSPLNNEKFKNIIKDFFAGNNDNELFIRQMMMIGLWYEVNFENSFVS